LARDRPKGMSWLRCPVCGSRTRYWRKLTRSYVCRICGTEYVADEKRRKTKKLKEVK